MQDPATVNLFYMKDPNYERKDVGAGL